MKQIDTIIFDLGGVLIDWNPRYVYMDVFNGDTQKVDWFLETICTHDWNENQDAGYPLAQATDDLVKQFPEYEAEIKAFYGRWEEMLGGPINETVAILDKLTKLDAYKVVALTNWSHETFPIAQEKFDFLQWFEGIVVSGEENTRKPFEDIYRLTLNRFNISPEKAIFIDDNLRNIEAARQLGINGIHFKNAALLLKELETYNIKLDD